MKKVAVVLSLVLLVSVMLVGCQNGGGTADGIIGKWTLTDVESGGVSLGSEMVSMFGEMSIEFKADGVVSVSMAGEGEDATYVENGDKVDISAEGEVVMSLVKKDGKLVIDEDGTVLVFSK